MKIAVIGAGNVGSALAKGFAKANHKIFLGVRDVNSVNVKTILDFSSNISAHQVSEAIKIADVVLFATPPHAAVEIAKQNSALKNKIIIDTTNSVFKKPEPYKNAFEGIKALTGNDNIVKCFNTTGFENMENAWYGDTALDMFTAGSNERTKEIAAKLSKDIGFEKCYDFGGEDKVELLEQFAMCWINLAILQKQGRGIAFKILKRE